MKCAPRRSSRRCLIRSMSSDAALIHDDPASLTLEELVAVQPRHLRGKLERGLRTPEGERPGRGRARSLDFEGLSPYQFGDDIRAIDWRASLRSGETTVKRFSAAAHRARVLVLDLKPTLFFGTDERLMAKTACLTTAWLAWAANVVNEPVGLAIGANVIAPRRGRKHVLRLLDVIANAHSAAKTQRAQSVEYDALAGLTGREDEICVVCELPEDCGALIKVGRTLSSVRNLRLFLVEDPVTTRSPAPGRYPVRGDDGQRQVLLVRDSSLREAEGLKTLKDAGWRIERARDLLPRKPTA